MSNEENEVTSNEANQTSQANESPDNQPQATGDTDNKVGASPNAEKFSNLSDAIDNAYEQNKLKALAEAEEVKEDVAVQKPVKDAQQAKPETPQSGINPQKETQKLDPMKYWSNNQKA
jgi:hypothetical protein